MTHYTLAPGSARARADAGVLLSRVHQRRTADLRARRHQLLEEASTVSRAAHVHLGSRIDVRMELDDSLEPPVTRARFACPCGWTMRSAGRFLVIPEGAKAHARSCPYAYETQTRLDELEAAS